MRRVMANVTTAQTAPEFANTRELPGSQPCTNMLRVPRTVPTARAPASANVVSLRQARTASRGKPCPAPSSMRLIGGSRSLFELFSYLQPRADPAGALAGVGPGGSEYRRYDRGGAACVVCGGCW